MPLPILMERELIINIAILLGVIVMVWLYRRASRPDNSMVDMYKEVLSSDKYKVKGRFEE